MIKISNRLLLLAVTFAGTALHVSAFAADHTIAEIMTEINQGRLEQADAMMQDVLCAHPKSAKAHFLEASILTKLGRNDAAKVELNTAESLDPDLLFASKENLQALHSQLSVSMSDKLATDSTGTTDSIASVQSDAEVLQAISLNRIPLLRDLLKRGGNPAAVSSKGMSALGLAISLNSIDAVNVLLEAQPAIVNQDYTFAVGKTTTPFYHALFVKNPSIVSALINAGVDVNKSTSDLLTPLMVTVFNNDVENFHLLVKAGANPRQLDQDHSTLLRHAAFQDHAEIIKALLNLGIDPNKRDDYGVSPLTVAAMNGNASSVRALLDGGAWTYPIDTFGETAVRHAQFAIKDTAKKEEIIQLLVSHGASLSVKNRPVDDAYLNALHRGDLKAVKVALEKGADINAHHIATLDYVTNEAAAIAVPYPEVLAYLIDHGVNLNACNPAGFTALNQAAASRGHTESIKMLVEHGLDVNHKTKNGFTPLAQAVNMNLPSTVELLLKLGADPNVRFPGRQSLVKMARDNHHSVLIAPMLLKAGAQDVQ